MLLLLTTVANVLLGLTVWAKQRTDPINRRFGVFSITLAAWTMSNALVDTYAGSPTGIIWARAAFGSAALIPLTVYLFVTVFPARRPAQMPGAITAYYDFGAIT